MRLYSFHPYYLDDDTLYLTWKRGMIAVRAFTGQLAGYEKSYANHRQLIRFKEQPNPQQAISDYMHVLVDEADRRGWNYPRFFQRSTLPKRRGQTRIPVTAGQMEFEVWHYARILGSRRGALDDYRHFFGTPEHRPHPIFELVRGPVGAWEKYR